MNFYNWISEGFLPCRNRSVAELHDCFKGQKAPERQLLPAYGIFRLFPAFHSSDSAAILPHSKTGNSSKDTYKNLREKFKQFLRLKIRAGIGCYRLRYHPIPHFLLFFYFCTLVGNTFFSYLCVVKIQQTNPQKRHNEIRLF